MKIGTIILCLMLALSSAQRLSAADGSPPTTAGIDAATPKVTSSEEVVQFNPIKLSIVKDAPAADLPVVNEPVGVADAIKIAMRESPLLQESKHSWIISKFMARAALGKLGPATSFNTFYARSGLSQTLFVMSDTPIAAWPMQNIAPNGSILSFVFSGRQPLFTGGRLVGGYRAARAHEHGLLAAYGNDRVATALRVRRTYWEAVWNKARLTLATDYVKYRELTVSNISAKVKEGERPKADLLREQAELARAQTKLNDTYRDYNRSIIRLESELAINLGSQLVLRDALVFVPTEHAREYFLSQAKKHHPELARANAQLAETKAKRLVALSKYSPQIDLYGIASNQTGRTPENSNVNVHGQWGAFVSIIGGVTMFDSGVRFNELRAANEAIRQAQAAIKQAEIDVAEQVSMAWIDLDLAAKNVQLAHARVVSAAEDERNVHERYEVGKEIPLEDFLSAVRTFDAKQSELEAIYKYRLAEADIIAASGSE